MYICSTGGGHFVSGSRTRMYHCYCEVRYLCCRLCVVVVVVDVVVVVVEVVVVDVGNEVVDVIIAGVVAPSLDVCIKLVRRTLVVRGMCIVRCLCLAADRVHLWTTRVKLQDLPLRSSLVSSSVQSKGR